VWGRWRTGWAPVRSVRCPRRMSGRRWGGERSPVDAVAAAKSGIGSHS